MREIVQQSEIFDDSCAVPKQSDRIVVRRLIQIEFSINIAERCACGWQLLQQSSFVLPRLDGVLFAGKPVDDRDLHACLPDSNMKSMCNDWRSIFTPQKNITKR